ncbi:MAG: hypothetical protein ACREQO_16225, partial [Candidatus Binatia bacterium]
SEDASGGVKHFLKKGLTSFIESLPPLSFILSFHLARFTSHGIRRWRHRSDPHRGVESQYAELDCGDGAAKGLL